jgi:alpha-L-fucosidase
LDWNGDKALQLSAIDKKITSSSVLTGGTAKVKQTAEKIEIEVPRAYRQDMDTIVALELDRPASGITPRKPPP